MQSLWPFCLSLSNTLSGKCTDIFKLSSVIIFNMIDHWIQIYIVPWYMAVKLIYSVTGYKYFVIWPLLSVSFVDRASLTNSIISKKKHYDFFLNFNKKYNIDKMKICDGITKMWIVLLHVARYCRIFFRELDECCACRCFSEMYGHQISLLSTVYRRWFLLRILH